LSKGLSIESSLVGGQTPLTSANPAEAAAAPEELKLLEDDELELTELEEDEENDELLLEEKEAEEEELDEALALICLNLFLSMYFAL